MSYRLKNSDFKPFFGILEEARDLWVYVGEGIVVHFGIFLSGESVPPGRGVEVPRDYLLTDWEG